MFPCLLNVHFGYLMLYSIFSDVWPNKAIYLISTLCCYVHFDSDQFRPLNLITQVLITIILCSLNDMYSNKNVANTYVALQID